MSDTVCVCIPTLNPGRWVEQLSAALSTLDPAPAEIVVIDSASDDGSVDRLAQAGARIERISRSEFDHGGTRNRVLDLSDADHLVFLTQDAIPVGPDAVAKLVAALVADARAGMAFGRQLPNPAASAATRAHRAMLYPETSSTVRPSDAETLGIRASFASNSFSAYRRTALEAIGRFPSRIVSHEDRWAAGMMLRHGWSVAYVADAQVVHSHEYTLGQTIRRYFDAGVFESTNQWHRETFGRPHGYGRQLVARQLAAAREDGPAAQAGVVARSAAALLGHQLGAGHRLLPQPVRRRLSMTPSYFG
ncbi:MAG TPA: glycosyltransferase [Mycobacteriales bacterium]|nr:glycosyltransferase [Mycobacteriales bacterium]